MQCTRLNHTHRSLGRRLSPSPCPVSVKLYPEKHVLVVHAWVLQGGCTCMGPTGLVIREMRPPSNQSGQSSLPVQWVLFLCFVARTKDALDSACSKGSSSMHITFFVVCDGSSWISSRLYPGICPGRRMAFASAYCCRNLTKFLVSSKERTLWGSGLWFPCSLVPSPTA